MDNTAQPPRAGHSLTTLDEFRSGVASLFNHANRGLAILTHDLEPELYDHAAFLEPLKKFILARSFARVRVLIVHPERTMKLGNEFVTMGRRLNSYIEIRHVKPALRDFEDAFCIADDRAVVYREDSHHWKGVVSQDPDTVRGYLKRFDGLWHDCEFDAEIRQLRL